MAKKLKDIFIELGSTSATYGIPHLTRSEKVYQKLFWIAFILVASLGSYYLIKDAIVNYLEFKVVTVIQTVYEQPSEFPTITFCGYSEDFNNTTPSEILNECFFSYDLTCNKNKDNYFETFYTIEFIQCFRFNSGINLTNHPIPVLNSTIGGFDDSFNIKLPKKFDLVLWIHNKSTPPKLEYRNSHSNNRIFASSNSYTSIALEKQVEIKLGEPNNDCLNDFTKFKSNKTIINHILKTNRPYTQEKCLELCFDLDYIETNPCNCTNVSLDDVWKTCWLDFEKKRKGSCTWEQKVKFYSKSIVEKCSQYCPLECTSVSFNVKYSSVSNYNSTRVRIYYSSLKYTLITQEPKMELIDLISNVGGTLGLLIGVSFLSFFEVFELLIEIFLHMKSKINLPSNFLNKRIHRQHPKNKK